MGLASSHSGQGSGVQAPSTQRPPFTQSESKWHVVSAAPSAQAARARAATRAAAMRRSKRGAGDGRAGMGGLLDGEVNGARTVGEGGRRVNGAIVRRTMDRRKVFI